MRRASSSTPDKPLVAIACGGTGGHLYPGMAVADALIERGAHVTLLVSAKAVDQHAVQSIRDMSVVTLPAVALTRGNLRGFLRGMWDSFKASRQEFRRHRPHAVLGMGGFTSAGPILAGKTVRAATFLHESNAIPGRANRWLSHFVDRAFVGFYDAAPKLPHQFVSTTGTPVRRELPAGDPAACRQSLGLHPDLPVLLIQGGSQGAHAINDLLVRSAPLFAEHLPDLQFLHLTGPEDFESVRDAYRAQGRKAAVFPFLTEMELALSGATLSVGRAGASSLSELAALRLPSILIPYPHAMDNHQYWNARLFADRNAARLLEQSEATPEKLVAEVTRLIKVDADREAMRDALAYWHSPLAAGLIAEKILALLPDLAPPRVPPKRPGRRGMDIEALIQREEAEERRKAELESALPPS